MKNYSTEELYTLLLDPVVAAYMSPAGFAMYASGGDWEFARHLQLLNDCLLKVAAGEITRLMVFMPPRHGKSELISKYFTAWYMGRFPKRNILLTGHESNFASSWGGKARDLLIEHGKKVFNVEVSKNISAASRWSIQNENGEMKTAGVGGALTGMGGDIIIIDDPLKGPEQARSTLIKEKQWDWYQTVVYTRQQPHTAIIIVLTRWNEDDIAGKLLQAEQQGGDKWVVIKLPALAEQNDPLGRKPGEALWPERFTRQKLEHTRDGVLSAYWWNALYQQHPSPDTGNIFLRHWFKRYSVMPKRFDKLVQSWDMSFKESETSSFVVCQIWGILGPDKYLIYQFRKRLNFPNTKKAFERIQQDYPQATTKLIEAKANGQAIIDSFKTTISGIIPIMPKESKEERAAAVSDEVEAGNVYLPEQHLVSWDIDAFIEECITFPNASNDDQVDAMTQFLNWILGKYVPIIRPAGVSKKSTWKGGAI